jgi:uncharacterized protein YjaG (DUF416 family)
MGELDIHWVRISSSVVSALAFCSIENKAYVKLKSEGLVCVYSDISWDIFRRVVNADSVGRAIALFGDNYSEVRG